MKEDATYSDFLFEYNTPDGVWSFTLPARDLVDAEEKLRGIRRTGQVLGEIKMRLPAQAGFFVKSFCFLRNLFA